MLIFLEYMNFDLKYNSLSFYKNMYFLFKILSKYLDLDFQIDL